MRRHQTHVIATHAGHRLPFGVPTHIYSYTPCAHQAPQRSQVQRKQ
jgi:hypothetical protein